MSDDAYDHEHGHGADADVLEVVRVGPPRLGVVDGLLRVAVVVVEGVACGVDELDGVFQLWRRTRSACWVCKELA